MKQDSLENLTVLLNHQGFQFSLAPECPQQEKLLAVVTGQAAPERYFRQGRRRNVMLLEGMVVKLYEFHKLIDLFHSYRYAPREVECYHDYVKAFGSLEGIRLPRLLGYFERPLLGHFHRANGVVTEFIPDARSLKQEELMETAPLFAQLYRKGIYHPDMHYGNVLRHATSGALIPIDYMGCNILEEPNWEALLIELARFLHTSRVDETKARAFSDAVLQRLPELHLDPERAWRCIVQLKAIRITTHQYRHPIFLPKELRRETMPQP